MKITTAQQQEIPLRHYSYPDTQQQVIIDHQLIGVDKVFITMSITSFQSIEKLFCAAKSLKGRNRNVEIHLYCPYFLGARSDRNFEAGDNHYLRDIICPIINDLNLASITLLDPHSYVLPGILNNCTVDTFKQHLFYNWVKKQIDSGEEIIAIAPDAGAVKRAELFGAAQTLYCAKTRVGETVSVIVPPVPNNATLVIVDDICDGGRTFIEIANNISKSHTGKVFLVVTHGIFSKGTAILYKHFNEIYSTDSFNTNTEIKQYGLFS